MMTLQELQGLIGQVTSREPCFFSSTLTWAAAASVGTAGALANQLIIPSGQHFFCTAIAAVMRSDATGRVMMADDNDGTSETGGWGDAPALVQIQNNGNNRFLFDTPTDCRLAFPASADSPRQLPTPWYVPPASTITPSATILKVPAAAVSLRITLHGFRVLIGNLN